MKKKRGFTLVELLAVIVILAIILVIAVPQIISVIESSRKGSIESTAKLIVSSAEREYTNRKILGKDTNVLCTDVASMNNNDYGTCSISFDNSGKATVKITGKGKFEGYTCNGNNTNMECTKNGNVSEYKRATEYIKELYDDTSTRTANGLKKDNTSDENIRYEGENPNNYVKFNDESWRIIGVFGSNVKIIRSESLGELSWDSSESTVNSGNGVNEWSTSDLKEYLNTMYYSGSAVTCYNKENNATTVCPTDSLNDTAKSMIDNHTWNTGAINIGDTTIVNQETYALNTVLFYSAERGATNGKICTSELICNDTVERTTTWTGYVGLPYVTDWAYASSEVACTTNMNDGYDAEKDLYDNMTCKNNNWMHHGSTMNEVMWTLSPLAHYGNAYHVWYVIGVGYVGGGFASSAHSVFPTVYLNSDVKITGGSGTSADPYILSN